MKAKRRSFGCRFGDELKYKDLELLVMQNELISISVLAGKGTDIISLLYKPADTEFMWISPKDFNSRDLFGLDFLEAYLGGWQEIIPNGGPPCVYRGASFGQHDETPMLPWQYEIVCDEPGCIEAKFTVSLRKTPLVLEKNIKILSNKPVIYIKEKLINRSAETIDFMWGHHPCFGEPFLSEDCIIDFNAEKIISNAQSICASPLVMPNAEGILKKFPSADGKGFVDLSKVQDKSARVADLLYVTGLKENWFSVTNKKKGLSIGFSFDPEVFKYLYFWLVYGGAEGYPWYGSTYSLAIEPWSSYPGLGLPEAVRNGTALSIKPGQQIETWLETTIGDQRAQGAQGDQGDQGDV